MTRSDIRKAINVQLEEAGTGQEIPYQIVFAATKTDIDPRIAARERDTVRAEKKAAKEIEKAAEKEAKAAEKAAKAEAKVKAAAKEAKAK